MIASEIEIVRALFADKIAFPAYGESVQYTRAFLEMMEEAGVIEGRVELIDGEIISKMGQKAPHSITVTRLILYLARTGVFADDHIRGQASVEVRQKDRVMNRPEPDVFVLRENVISGMPSTDDILLAVEISDTTQADDFGRKAALYARSGVAEYWVVDLAKRTLTFFRKPDKSAETWGDIGTLTETDSIAPESAPNHPVLVAKILPPPVV